MFGIKLYKHLYHVHCTHSFEWISSLLLDWSQQVYYNGHLSVKLLVLFGVPQGSVLGPLICLLYMAELSDVIAECGCTGHAYANDTHTEIFSLKMARS